MSLKGEKKERLSLVCPEQEVLRLPSTNSHSLVQEKGSIIITVYRDAPPPFPLKVMIRGFFKQTADQNELKRFGKHF